jgi:hypothetical protein
MPSIVFQIINNKIKAGLSKLEGVFWGGREKEGVAGGSGGIF